MQAYEANSFIEALEQVQQDPLGYTNVNVFVCILWNMRNPLSLNLILSHQTPKQVYRSSSTTSSVQTDGFRASKGREWNVLLLSDTLIHSMEGEVNWKLVDGLLIYLLMY